MYLHLEIHAQTPRYLNSYQICACVFHSDYTAGYRTVDVTIPTFPHPTAVNLVNNWIVLQHNIDLVISFNRPWSDYRDGFGSYPGNFGLGLEKLHQLTNNNLPTRLRIELLTTAGVWVSAEYTTFQINSESSWYRINVNGYSGDMLSDPFNRVSASGDVVNGMAFSTYDQDHDLYSGNCCLTTGRNGFWYNACGAIMLTADVGSSWFYSFYGQASTPLSESRMMIKLA